MKEKFRRRWLKQKCRSADADMPSPLPRSRRQEGRTIPSFRIFDCKVERFSPSFAAAPLDPPIIQLVSRRTMRMCSPSGSSSLRLSLACAGGPAARWDLNSGSVTSRSGPAKENNGALDYVLEFADIARPVVFGQRDQGSGRDRFNGLPKTGSEVLSEPARK